MPNGYPAQMAIPRPVEHDDYVSPCGLCKKKVPGTEAGGYKEIICSFKAHELEAGACEHIEVDAEGFLFWKAIGPVVKQENTHESG